MARQWLRAWAPIGLAAALLWTGLSVIDLSSAEAGRAGSRGGGSGGGFRSGSHGSIGHGSRGGISHGFHGGVTHGFHHGFHNHKFHHHGHNHFFFSVGVGAFFPYYYYPYYYPAGYPYPYPVYYPAYTPTYSYSPCGYYDPNGVWINAPCPPSYAPPVSAPQQEGSSQGVSDPSVPSSEGTAGSAPPGY